MYALGPDTVAKVWTRRTGAEVRALAAFYADLNGAGLPFATPLVLEVAEHGGRTVSLERRLDGVPLRLYDDRGELDGAAVSALAEVLRALAAVPAPASARALPVLGEALPFWHAEPTFGAALAALIGRRVPPWLDLWRAHVHDFGALCARVQGSLRALPPAPDAPLHGDLFGDNVLIGPGGEVRAVLDFGFVTTAGDPAFDAAVCAAIADLYGPQAAQTRMTLTQTFARSLGHDPARLHLYQLAYALATGTCFSQDGTDGHFQWAAALLSA